MGNRSRGHWDVVRSGGKGPATGGPSLARSLVRRFAAIGFLVGTGSGVFATEDEACGPPGLETAPGYIQDLRHHDRGRRMRAAFLLGRMGAEHALPALAACMGDEDARVRLFCGEAVAKLNAEAFEKELTGLAAEAVEVLLKGRDIGARPHAAAFLAAARVEGTQAALIAAVRDRDNQNINVRASAAVALGAFRGKDVSEALVEALSDPHFVVRLSAVRALERVGGAEAARALKSLLQDSNEQVRERVLHALAILEPPQHPTVPLRAENLKDGG